MGENIEQKIRGTLMKINIKDISVDLHSENSLCLPVCFR